VIVKVTLVGISFKLLILVGKEYASAFYLLSVYFQLKENDKWFIWRFITAKVL